MTGAEIQSLILRLLSQKNMDTRLGHGRHYLAEAVRNATPTANQPDYRQIMEGVWSLIGQGLAYIDYSQSATENWSLHLTASGRAAANDEEINPDDPAGYIRYLLREVSDLSEIVKGYVHEALHAYNARLYRASAVMLGVASEAAVLEVAATLGQTLQGTEAQHYLDTINAHRRNYIAKFEAFRKKLESKKSALPQELTDGLDLTMNAVGDLLRVCRNDAGHPTGKGVDRDDCFIHLHMFVRYVKKLYAVKACLEGLATAGT